MARPPRGLYNKAMIGGGNRIGGPPPGAPKPPAEAVVPKPAQAADAAPSAPKPSDKFEKAAARPSMLGAHAGVGTLAQSSGGGDLLKLVKDNPAAAARIADGLAAQAKSTLGDIERELRGARALIDKLASERFTKAAVEKLGQDLRRVRERLSGLKARYRASLRKMAYLQQVGGQLAEAGFVEDMDRILSQHGKLKTDWGRRYYLLSLGQALYDGDDEAPEHLRDVVRAEVRAGDHGEQVADAMHQISPRRIIAELIARTLDGTTATAEPVPAELLRGDHGRSLQSYAMLAGLLEGSLEKDPLSKG